MAAIEHGTAAGQALQVSADGRPLVSVVVPTHRCGPWLEEAVGSVLDQSIGDFEVLVVDDGVPDGLGRVERMDTRVRVVLSAGKGVAMARNTGNAAAAGRYVATLDGDDRWLPDKLEFQLARLEDAPRAALCHTQFEIIDDAGAVTGPGWAGPFTLRSAIVGKGSVLQSTVLWRRDLLMALGGYDPGAEPVADADLFLRAVERFEFAYCPEVLVQYRVHAQQVSGVRRYRDVFEAASRTNRAHEPRLAAACPGVKPRLAQASRRVYVNVACDAALEAIRRADAAKALGHLAWMVKVDSLYSGVVLGRRSVAYVGRRVRRLAPRGRWSPTDG